MANLTLIQLLGNNQGNLEVASNVKVPLNFSIGDIRDISKKNGAFSKSIILPSTPDNDRLLNYYFDINIQGGTFDVNVIQDCVIIQNGVVILDNAVLQLVSINKIQGTQTQDDVVTYTVLVKDTTSNFFTEINNQNLDNLDLSDLTHTYKASVVIDSFDHTVVDGYKYLMPFNPSVTDDTQFNLDEFTPGIYAKTYMDRIFARAGYGYVWDDLTASTINFDKLLIPYNGGEFKPKLDGDLITGVEANGSTTQLYNQPYNGVVIQTPPYAALAIGTETYDPNNYYNPTLSRFVFPVGNDNPNNEVEFKFVVTYEVYIVNNSGANAFAAPRTPTSVAQKGISLRPTISIVRPSTRDNSSINGGGDFINYNVAYPAGTTVIKSATTTTTITSLNPFGSENFDFQLLGRVTGMRADGSTEPSGYNWYGAITNPRPATVDVEIYTKITNVVMEIIPKFASFGFGSPINLNNFIPKKIKQSEFLKSIFTMYNCVVEVNPDNPKQLVINQRDKYYDNGKVADWTKKLAQDKGQDLKFLPELQSKKLTLTYKEGKDSPNTTYLQATSEVYGQQEYTFDNQYAKGNDKQEVIFSPSPSINTNFGAILPMVNGKAPKTNIRVLYDGGEYTCGDYTIENFTGDIVTGSTFPFLSNWNKPFNPTFDINFGVCDFYFRNDDYGSITNNNLFNLHWRRTFNQINTGRLLTAHFDLNELDIHKLKLSDKIRIDNSWWNINKVIDYDANSNSLTKVELISIDDSLQIPFETRTVSNLTNGSTTGKDGTNGVNDGRERETNTWNTLSSGTVYGRNNTFNEGFQGGLVMGNRNYLNQDAIVQGNSNQVFSRSMVMGDNNIVNPQAFNSIVIGSDFDVVEPETLYSQNIVLPSGGTFNGNPSSSVSGLIDRGTGTDAIVQINSANPNGANGLGAFAQGGDSFANGAYAHSEGLSTIASGDYSHAEGQDSSATGDWSHAQGRSSIASGDYSNAQGVSSEASGNISCAGGFGSKAVQTGEWARSSWSYDIGTPGQSQYGMIDYNRTTTDALVTELFLNQGNTERLTIGTGEVFRIRVYAIAKTLAGANVGDSKEFTALALIKNVGGTVSFVGIPNLTSSFGDISMSTAAITLVADNTNKAFRLNIQGIAATSITFAAWVRYIKIS